MKHPGSDIDPLLAAEIARAAPGERIEALLLLRGEARASLAAAGAAGERSLAAPARNRTTESATGATAGAAAAVPAFVRAALGGTALSAVDLLPFPALGALYVAGPVEFMRRLLAAPEIASATRPDAQE